MYSKIRLDQTKKYELVIATFEFSTMLVDYLEWREHHRSFGSEQGDIPKWDDFIIEKSNGDWSHVQIKRQETNFDDHPCDRDRYVHGKRAGQLRDLSAFDESLAELATWVSSNDPATAIPPREFRFELPDNGLLIKAGYSIRNFNALCELCNKPTTTPASLAMFASTDTAAANGYDWLTSWCGFTDWTHILKAFKYLRATQTGDEQDIKRLSKDILNRCFNNTDTVVTLIKDYIDDNSNAPNSVTPRRLLETLHVHLRSDVNKWTQFSKAGSVWNVSGTHDSTGIEMSNAVVIGIWGSEFTSYLKLNSSCPPPTNKITQALIRLGLHFKNNGSFHVPNKDLWLNIALTQIGETLGIDEDDCNHLAFHEYVAFLSSDIRELDSPLKQDQEATDLHLEMHRYTYEKVKLFLEDKIIGVMPASELRDAIHAKWTKWKTILDSKEPEQIHFFTKMLHPTAEGEDIIAEARVGIQTIHLISKGIYYLLIVSEALGLDSDTFYLDSNIYVKALKQWSGPHGHPRRSRSITDNGITEFLGKESSEILVLSGSDASNSELMQFSMGDFNEGDTTENIARSHTPKCVLTSNGAFKQLIQNGSISDLKDYITEEISKRDKQINDQIEKLQK